ncbi:MAG: DUF1565 domain-containing protein [Candidatus Kariarchaeaceae archaeon]|jgi:hypothetical protein
MSNQTIPELKSLQSDEVAEEDLLAVVDVDSPRSPTGENKNIKFEELAKALDLDDNYSASTVYNDSNVPGPTVKEALEAISIGSGINNDSNIPGTTVSDALDYLSESDNINNDSTVPGNSVTDALDALAPCLTAGGGVAKETVDFSNSFIAGDVIRRTPSGYVLADAENISTSEVLGLIESASTANFTVVFSGRAEYTHGFPNGEILFLASGSGLSLDPPEFIGMVSKPIGTVLDSETIIVQTYRGLEVASGSGQGESTGITTASLVHNDSRVAGSEVRAALNNIIGNTPNKTVFVDGNGPTSPTEDGTRNRPYKTVGQGISSMDSGDKLVVAPGTYNENLSFPDEEIYFDGPGANGIMDVDLGSSEAFGRLGKVEFHPHGCIIHPDSASLDNGECLSVMYEAGNTKNNLSTNNRYVVELMPGLYRYSGSAAYTITAADYVDIIGKNYTFPTSTTIYDPDQSTTLPYSLERIEILLHKELHGEIKIKKQFLPKLQRYPLPE